MKTAIPNLSLRGVAAAVPSTVFDLRELEETFGERDVARIIQATGIRKIRMAEPGQCASDLCEAAARELLRVLDVDAAQVDGIVFVSQTPDYILPATGVLLQHRLGLPKAACSFDINYGSSGYVYGLLQAALLIAAGGCRTVLVCAGDVLTPYVHHADRANRMVFGDAGSASLVTRGEDVFIFNTYTDGSGAGSLIIRAGGAREPHVARVARSDVDARGPENFHMDGMSVLNFAINVVPDFIAELLCQAGWEKNTLNFLGLHQANRFLVGNLRRILELPEEIVPFACAETGNTGPASIPLLLSLRHASLRAGASSARAVLCGYGVGYSAAGVCLPLRDTVFVPPVVSAVRSRVWA